MKGYVPASILAEIESRTGKPCHELFDFITGTSIGGILAAIIADGQPASVALDFFTQDGPEIFGHTQLFGTGGIIRPRYGSDVIERCLKKRLGLGQMSSTKRPLLITSFDLVAYDPYMFRSYDGGCMARLWEAARATSAAQTYFPAFKLGDKVLWDGGNACNNPAALALSGAVQLWGKDEDYAIVSLGCGSTASKCNANDLINSGILKVASETMSLLFEANDDLPNLVLSQLFGEDFIRIQPATGDLPIDGASKADLANLKEAATACISAYSGTIDKICAKVS